MMKKYAVFGENKWYKHMLTATSMKLVINKACTNVLKNYASL